MINYKKGDLLELADSQKFDIIVHGCNCFNTMGAGVAKAIKQKWPQAYQADLATRPGDKNKLGTITHTDLESKPIIVNAYTQYHYGRGGNYLNYDALESSMKRIKELADSLNRDCDIAMPKIGSGLAGGDWEIISTLIDLSLGHCNHNLIIIEYEH